MSEEIDSSAGHSVARIGSSISRIRASEEGNAPMTGDSAPEQEPDETNNEFVEVDPTGRYGRYQEVLGKGAFKTVYKAFDELEGIEVAWNQVKVADLQRNVDDFERLCSEVHLLQTLKHKNIIKFYISWIDTKNDNINFITEVFTSGTLRQYRQKHKHVDIRALKNWSRQILSGLLYLHSHDPPVIHRDLKCDNILINGNQGEVKIGDLGLAAILHHANSAHSIIGTPEFMAPELYEEEYNELVDIYAFGMCLLELVTFEYPYAECSNAAQIYKKVSSGVKPASLAKVKDPEVKRFIKKCIANVSERLSARELLLDSFLQIDADDTKSYSLRISQSLPDNAGLSNVSSSYVYHKVEPGSAGRDFAVEGERKDMNTIFLKLWIADSTGEPRNIHFPFDIDLDTSVSVATEMVAELDLTDQDVTSIAAMIDAEIHAYVPDWIPGGALDNHSNDVTVSDRNGHDLETVNEISVKPSGSDSSSAGITMKWPSTWSVPPKGASGDSTSFGQKNSFPELDSHLYRSEDAPIAVHQGKDNSFNNDDKGKCHPNSSSSPGQQCHSPQLDGEGKLDIVPPIPSNLRCASSIDGLSHDYEEAPHAQSQLCNRGTNSELHDGDDKQTLVEKDSVDIHSLSQKLEYLLIEQRRELDEIQRKHNCVIAEQLKELSPEQRTEVLNKCRAKVNATKAQTTNLIQDSSFSKVSSPCQESC